MWLYCLLFWNCWHFLLSLDLHPLSQQATQEGREDRTEMKWEKRNLQSTNNWQWADFGKRIWWRKTKQRSYPVMKRIPLAEDGKKAEVSGQENLLEGNTHPSTEQASWAQATCLRASMCLQQPACHPHLLDERGTQGGGVQGLPTYSVSTMPGHS